MKVVYNNCFGGFGLSHKATMRYAELKGLKVYAFVRARDADGLRIKDEYIPVKPGEEVKRWDVEYYTSEERFKEDYWYLGHMEEDRSDPILIQVLEELGEEANGDCAQLAITDIPAGTAYRIDEYDGNESVMTMDSYNWKIAE